MAAMDTTNLRLSVTPPASGRVFVRLRGTLHGATTMPGIFLGVLEGSTIRMRCAPFHNSLNAASGNATDLHACEASAVISGLTPSTPVNWDAAWAVDAVVASSGLKTGGPETRLLTSLRGVYVRSLGGLNASLTADYDRPPGSCGRN